MLQISLTAEVFDKEDENFKSFREGHLLNINSIKASTKSHNVGFIQECILSLIDNVKDCLTEYFRETYNIPIYSSESALIEIEDLNFQIKKLFIPEESLEDKKRALENRINDVRKYTI